MRIEPEQIEQICDTLRQWGYAITDSDLADLIEEFNVVGPSAGRAKRMMDRANVAANQLGKFRSTDPATSREAAKMNYPRSGSQRHKALVAIAQAGERGITASEAEVVTGVPFRSLTPRLGELKDMKLVKPNGKTREGTMGAQQSVLVLTELGRMQVRRHDGL